MDVDETFITFAQERGGRNTNKLSGWDSQNDIGKSWHRIRPCTKESWKGMMGWAWEEGACV